MLLSLMVMMFFGIRMVVFILVYVLLCRIFVLGVSVCMRVLVVFFVLFFLMQFIEVFNIRRQVMLMKFCQLGGFLLLLLSISVMIVVNFIIYDSGFYMNMRNLSNLFILCFFSLLGFMSLMCILVLVVESFLCVVCSFVNIFLRDRCLKFRFFFFFVWLFWQFLVFIFFGSLYLFIDIFFGVIF